LLVSSNAPVQKQSFADLVLQPLAGLSSNILKQTSEAILKPQHEDTHEQKVNNFAREQILMKPKRKAPQAPLYSHAALSASVNFEQNSAGKDFYGHNKKYKSGQYGENAFNTIVETESKQSLTPLARKTVPVPTPPHTSIPLPAPHTERLPLASSLQSVSKTLAEEKIHDIAEESLESIQNPVLDDKFADGRIHVVARCRPKIPEDDEADIDPYRQCVNTKVEDCKIVLKREFCQNRAFRVDNVLSETSSQEEAFKTVAEDIVKSVETGVNGTIMCYGQTGGGKTYTAFGNEKEHPSKAGIIPRCVKHMFRYAKAINDIPGQEASIRLSLLQIYMENITDLFAIPANGTGKQQKEKSLQIREDSMGNVFVQGLKCVEAVSPDNVMALVKKAMDGRISGETRQNTASSRSHAVLQLHLEQSTPADHVENDACLNENEKVIKTKFSTLTIVDLAGSERVAKSRSKGQRLQEARKINKSISALGNCISALAEAHGTGNNKRHIPFRNSQLTRLLTDSLGGNTRTCLCVNIGPAAANYEETYASMLLARRAMQVRNCAQVNEVHGLVKDKPEPEEEPVENEPEASVEQVGLLDPVGIHKTLLTTQLGLLNPSDEDIENTQKTLLLAMSTPLASSRNANAGFFSEPASKESTAPGGTTTLKKQNDALRKRILALEIKMCNISNARTREIENNSKSSDVSDKMECGEWETREHELVEKFTGIIHNLQMEIAKQNVAMAKLRKSLAEEREKNI
jgi:hypothetical protein